MLELLASKGVGALMGGLGQAIGGGGPFMGGDAQSGAYGVSLEKGGAVYNFGGTNTSATRTERTTEQAGAPALDQQWDTGTEPVQAGGSWIMMAALGLVAWGFFKRQQ